MGELADMIRASRLFHNVLPDTIQNCIISFGKKLTYQRGTTLFLQQERVTDAKLLLSGKVKIGYYLENGNENIQHMLFPPDIVGIDLISTHTKISPYQAVALEDSAVFSFPSALLFEKGIIPEDERLKCIENLLVILSHISIKNEYRMAILLRRSLRERILIYLTMQADKKQTDSFLIPFSRNEMASFLNVDRSALSHELSLLKQEGAIDFHKNHFTLLGWKDTRHLAHIMEIHG